MKKRRMLGADELRKDAMNSWLGLIATSFVVELIYFFLATITRDIMAPLALALLAIILAYASYTIVANYIRYKKIKEME